MIALRKLEVVEPSKAYLGFAHLSVGYHKILEFRLTKNKYGKKGEKSVLIELEDQVLFLPSYFKDKLTSDDISELNSSIGKNIPIYIFFGGKDERTK